MSLYFQALELFYTIIISSSSIYNAAAERNRRIIAGLQRQVLLVIANVS